MAWYKMFVLLYFNMAWIFLQCFVNGDNASTEDTDITQKNVTVTDDTPHAFSSPDFPNCCTPQKYMFVKAEPYRRMNWKVLFTDLDLPPLSQLTIYGIKKEGDTPTQIDAATYFDGQWIRPVILYDGHAILIEFLPAKNTLTSKAGKEDSGQSYLGFKATYWLDSDTWNLDRPYTMCPPIGDPIDRNEVTISDLSRPFDRQHYRLHCIWLVKPVPDSDMQIFIDVKLSGSDSKLKIRNGLTSNSALLHESDSLGSRTFSSNKGLYVELIKPVETGEFTMSAGVHKVILSNDKECVLKLDGRTIDGFNCNMDKDNLCIPLERKCDDFEDCPNGIDEKRSVCVIPTTTTMRPTTQRPVTDSGCPRGWCKDGRCPQSYNERCPEVKCDSSARRCPGTLLCMSTYLSCPGEKCRAGESTCKDGSCVFFYNKCEDGSTACNSNSKRCKSGKCVKRHRRCPEDPCEDYKPFKCGDKCLYDKQVCNGWRDCQYGEDEMNCPEKEKKSYIKYEGNRLLYLLFLIVPAALCCCWCCCRWCNDKDTPQNGTTAETQRMTTLPVHVSQINTQPAYVTGGINNFATDNNYSDSTAPFLAPTNPSEPDAPPASAPPAYGDVMRNQDLYRPTPEAPPAYSDLPLSMGGSRV